MIPPRPHTAVQWSAPSGVRVGTVADRYVNPAAVGEVPMGHTPVLTTTGVVNVMTVALRPYAPTAESLAEMRAWLADVAPTEDDLDLVAELSDSDVVRAVSRLSADGVAVFV